MKKQETRIVTVYYCDNCGQEIHGNMGIIDKGTENEKHLCRRWIESLQDRCDLNYKFGLDKENVNQAASDAAGK